MPLKKKKRIDPAVLKVRVERQTAKCERQILQLEKEPRQAIPILEYQLTNSDIRDLNKRPRHVANDFGLTDEALRGARRLWGFYRHQQSRLQWGSLRKVERAQENAISVLEKIDKDLYDNTLTLDKSVLIPYRPSHMRRETGPNKDYKPPDGYIKDQTKVWIM